MTQLIAHQQRPADLPRGLRWRRDRLDSLQTRHVEPIQTYWHWGIDVMPLMDHGGRPSGDLEPSGGSKTR